MTILLGFKYNLQFKSFPLNNALFIVSVTKNAQFRVMQVIFVLFFSLDREIHIFVRTAKLQCREIRDFA